MFQKAYFVVVALIVSFFVFVVNAFAITPWDDLVTAADVTGLATSITAILVLMVGLTILFTAYKFIKRAISR